MTKMLNVLFMVIMMGIIVYLDDYYRDKVLHMEQQIECLIELSEREKQMTQEQLQLFYAILETKNSWGKNEIKTILLEVVSGIRTRV